MNSFITFLTIIIVILAVLVILVQTAREKEKDKLTLEHNEMSQELKRVKDNLFQTQIQCR